MTPILPYVEQIATADQEVRRAAVLGALQVMGCLFEIQRAEVEGSVAENIVVPLGPGTPRLVIGAHYDSVPTSSGANDNGSGVAVLLDMIRNHVDKPFPAPLEIVFFDLEERERLGSRAYVEQVVPDSICAMINLDICGVGDTIVIAPQENLDGQLLQRIVPMPPEMGIQVIERLPPGDETSFSQAGIPSITVGIVPRGDVELLQALMRAQPGKGPVQMPSVLETIHNGCRDSIDVIEESALQMLRHWLLELIKQYSRHTTGLKGDNC